MAKEMDTPFTDDKAIALPDTEAFKSSSLSRFVEERFSRSKTARRLMKNGGSEPTETTEVFTVLTQNLQTLRRVVSFSRLQR